MNRGRVINCPYYTMHIHLQQWESGTRDDRAD